MKGHIHREGFKDLTRVEDALRILMRNIGQPALKLERVEIRSSLGRILGERIVAHQFIPPADKSVMDGYAVRSEDIQSASEKRPTILKVTGESRLGRVCRVNVKRRTAITVATGSLIPTGADAVVKVESTTSLPGDRIEVHAPVRAGESISKKGEDIAPGKVVLARGKRLRSQDIGILKRLGFNSVKVVGRLRIGILSTGNELVDSPKKNTVANVVDINRPLLASMVLELGARPIDLGIVKDRETDIINGLVRGLKTCDLVLITAGSSVGRKDLVPECINKLGKPGMLVHGIAMRPSMPTGIGVVNGKPILSLPGFPVSAIFAFRVFCRPLIAKLMGTEEAIDPVVRAVLKERVSGLSGCRTFVRVKVRRSPYGLVAEPLKLQRASLMMSMVAANGIVTIPEGVAAFEAGQVVDVSVIGEIE